MASGYDISASTSMANATNSASGPSTSGGVSLGDVTVGGPAGSGLLFAEPAAISRDNRGVVKIAIGAAVLGFGLWLWKGGK